MTTQTSMSCYGDETITLHYEEDLDGLATVSTDRTDGVPVGGQVHVTVSDFRLNLDPTGEDVWIVYTDGSMAAYEHDEADRNHRRRKLGWNLWRLGRRVHSYRR